MHVCVMYVCMCVCMHVWVWPIQVIWLRGHSLHVSMCVYMFVFVEISLTGRMWDMKNARVHLSIIASRTGRSKD